MLLSLRPSVAQVLLFTLGLMALCTWYQYYTITPLDWKVDRSLSQSRYGMHTSRLDGLLEVNMSGRHPMWDLLEDAERQWNEMKARQSTTLAAAVTEYTRRNGYPPPAGFDLWWEFVQKHNVKLVDEFDQINYDITPYLALSPQTFRARTDALSDPNNAYHVNITNGHVHIYGPHWFEGNSRQVASMMGAFSGALPDLIINGHDQARGDQWIGEDLRRAADAKARAGEYFAEEELQHFESLGRNPHIDRKNFCLPDDPIFNMTESLNTTTFIASHLTAMSPCANPRVHRTPPLLFAQAAHAPRLTPHFVLSKHRPDSGLLLPSDMWDYYDPLLVVPHAWEDRQGNGEDKLYWRGPVTGWNWNKGIGSQGSGITWRDGTRAKLALAFGANATQGQEVEVLMEKGGFLVTKKFDRALLNDKWMDVGVTGEPIQCSQKDGTCEEMRQTPMWKESDAARMRNRKKFVVDVDSNAWSDEFQRKLSWGNVVFKSTIYPEWNTQWLIPYYHYIPVQPEYSDVYNIVAFFRGDPDTDSGGHEEAAEKISRHASEFAREYWRWEDMQAYFFRLMLEYVRLGRDDREAASFYL